MQTFLQDLRYATRQLIRNLGLTITAAVSLALGIGATTAVFSLIYATLMNPYPYPAADRIVRLRPQRWGTSAETSAPAPRGQSRIRVPAWRATGPPRSTWE
jgi:hypothetical protein